MSCPQYSDPLIPSSLEAVCLKALASDPKDRYKNVLDLQKEILDYRQGFATDAENASLLKLMRLWYKRHRTLSIASIIIIFISLFTSWFAFNNLQLEKLNALQKAEKSELEASKLKLENEYHRKFNKGAAPRFLERAQVAFNSYNFDDARNFCDSAVELDPTLQDAWTLKGTLHLIYEEFNSAIIAFKKAHKRKKLLELSQEFARLKPDDKSGLSIQQFTLLFKRVQQMNHNHLTSGLIHQKAYSNLSLEQRIQFCKKILVAHNQ